MKSENIYADFMQETIHNPEVIIQIDRLLKANKALYNCKVLADLL